MAKDWNGNANSILKNLGSSHHTEEEREENDYYATDPKAVELLLELEEFSENIWEPSCGEGHISKVLEDFLYRVKSSDLIDRGYGITGIDFLKCEEFFEGDIITNPPYKYAQEFIEKSLSLIPEGNKVAMFLKTLFLESKGRKILFEKYPPKIVYISSGRIGCAKKGDFENNTIKAVSYAWFIWEKGFKGDPIIKWFN